MLLRKRRRPWKPELEHGGLSAFQPASSCEMAAPRASTKRTKHVEKLTPLQRVQRERTTPHRVDREDVEVAFAPNQPMDTAAAEAESKDTHPGPLDDILEALPEFDLPGGLDLPPPDDPPDMLAELVSEALGDVETEAFSSGKNSDKFSFSLEDLAREAAMRAAPPTRTHCLCGSKLESFHVSFDEVLHMCPNKECQTPLEEVEPVQSYFALPLAADTEDPGRPDLSC